MCDACICGSVTDFVLVSIYQLIFADEDIHLSVSVIYVHGRMRIGSRQCRILSDVTISFKYVAGKSVNFYDLGIVVSRSGQLDLHGKRFYPTWTRLGDSAWAGSNYLSVKVSAWTNIELH